jgi:hypothetical protein
MRGGTWASIRGAAAPPSGRRSGSADHAVLRACRRWTASPRVVSELSTFSALGHEVVPEPIDIWCRFSLTEPMSQAQAQLLRLVGIMTSVLGGADWGEAAYGPSDNEARFAVLVLKGQSPDFSAALADHRFHTLWLVHNPPRHPGRRRWLGTGVHPRRGRLSVLARLQEQPLHFSAGHPCRHRLRPRPRSGPLGPAHGRGPPRRTGLRLTGPRHLRAAPPEHPVSRPLDRGGWRASVWTEFRPK